MRYDEELYLLDTALWKILCEEINMRLNLLFFPEPKDVMIFRNQGNLASSYGPNSGKSVKSIGLFPRKVELVDVFLEDNKIKDSGSLNSTIH